MRDYGYNETEIMIDPAEKLEILWLLENNDVESFNLRNMKAYKLFKMQQIWFSELMNRRDTWRKCMSRTLRFASLCSVHQTKPYL